MPPRNRLAILVVMGLVATSLAAQPAVAEFGPIAGPYPYEQPDAAGDVTPTGADWVDITALRITTRDDGSLLIQMKFVDLAHATGELRYCVFFSVGGQAYQTGYRGQLANGGATSNPTPCSWGSRGTSVGTPTWVVASDIILVAIDADAIGNPSVGTPLTGIRAEIGWVAPVVGQGATDFHDVLVPSVQPTDFLYGLGASGLGPVEEHLLLTANVSQGSAEPGGHATFGMDLENLGDASVEYSINATGLPEGFAASFDPETGSLEAGQTQAVNVTVEIPEAAAPGTVAFNVTVAGPGGGHATLVLTLQVLGLDDGTAEPVPGSDNATATNETAGPDSVDGGGSVPAPGVAILATALLVGFLLDRRRRGT